MKQEGEAASSLLRQFMDDGYVHQSKDGGFTVPGVSKSRTFHPFGDN